MKKIIEEKSSWSKALPLGVYLTFVSHVALAQDPQFGRDNDGDRYVFYPFTGGHLRGELFKNERNMYAMFLHFQTQEVHTPEHPHIEIFLKNDTGEYIIRPMTIEYIHNSLTDISTLSIAIEAKDFQFICDAKEVEFLTMETTDGERKSFINIPGEERITIPKTANNLKALEFSDQ